jgi:uncharacterized protein involved in type VI secretion and phage assembly
VTAPTIPLISLEVKVNGSALSDVVNRAIIQVRVGRGLCVIGRATIRFRDADYAVSSGSVFALGASVSVAVPDAGSVFTGSVTGVRLEQTGNAQPEFVVTVDDAAYKLLAAAPPQTYLQSSYSDVLKKLAGSAGLTLDDGAESTAVSPYLLRTGTALAYLDALARRAGFVWWVDDKKLVTRKVGTSSTTTTLTMATDLISFGVRASGLRPHQVAVTGWDLEQQQTVRGQSTSSPYQAPDADLVQPYTKAQVQKAFDSKPEVARLFPTTNDEANALAASALAEAEAAGVVARGTCYANLAVVPGSSVKIANAGPAAGTYYVSEVEHVFDKRGFTTRFVAGPVRPTGLVDTLGTPAPDPGLSTLGLVVGVVTDTKDKEKNYRVKVKFPALSDTNGTWARVISLGAGGSRGLSFQPEVNDEVIVGFEFGDIRRPVVLGAVYSPKNELPKASETVNAGDGKVDYRRITSRLGHVVELGDGSDPTKQYILLQLADGSHKVSLGKQETQIEIPSGDPLTIKAGNASFEIDKQGNITIKGMKITLQGQTEVNIQGMKIAVKADTQLQAQGAMVDVKADGMANVQASGILGLKGSMVNIN